MQLPEHTNGVNGHVNHTPSTHNNAAGTEPIAIVGIGLRLPSHIRDTDSFWEFLLQKTDAKSPVPETRYNSEGFHGMKRPGGIPTKEGYFLTDVDLADIDISSFPMRQGEAAALDPQQRLLFEVVYECLQSGGQKDFRGKNIGCFIGSFGDDWQEIQWSDHQTTEKFRASGSVDFFVANRLSYEFGFTGPSFLTRTACSSSLSGLHVAVNSLRNGDCSAAVVGTANLILTPSMTNAIAGSGALSPDASCKTFDAKANGYVRSEAVSALFIKKLSDAQRDGDPIRAVIRGTSANSDGRTRSLGFPSVKGQANLMQRAYEDAGVPVSQTAYIECHGTGTVAGDAVEAGAVAKVFGKDGIIMGSIKPNLGHAEGAAGLTSVIKAVLALEHKTIPPNIKFNTPSPAIPWEKARLSVPVDPMPWPADRALRVSVNSFGIGGSNAHAVLESAENFVSTNKSEPKLLSSEPQLLLFSANHPSSVEAYANAVGDYIIRHPDNLQDVAYTLQHKREHLTSRSFAVLKHGEQLQASSVVSTSRKTCTFVFSGQGAQWAQMGKDLLENFPVFQQSISHLENCLRGLETPPQWSIQEELLKTSSDSRINCAELSQPLCTAIQIALVDLLGSWGVLPSAVVGFSAGEIAAAYAAGAITAEEAIVNGYYRGLVTKGLTDQTHLGGMAAVGLSFNDAQPLLETGVIVGCIVGPKLCTLSGEKKALASTISNIKEKKPETFVREVNVDIAYHSSQMKSVEEEYKAFLEKALHPTAPKVPFFSTVTGQMHPDGEVLSASYWGRGLVSPVRFTEAVEQLLENTDDETVFVEIGPHSTLSGPLKEMIGSTSNHVYVSTLKRDATSTKCLLTTAGQLFTHSVNVQIKYPSCSTTLIDLPNYQWHYEQKHWAESRVCREWRLRQFPHHDLLGSRVTECNGLEPVWRNMLRLGNVPWLRDHSIRQDIIFPTAGYVSMAGEAVRQVTGIEDYTVRDVTMEKALILTDAEHEISFGLRPKSGTEWFDFVVCSFNGRTWDKHCFGQVKGGFEEVIEMENMDDLARQMPASRIYNKLGSMGLYFGPRFRGLSNICTSPTERKARADIAASSAGPEESRYQLHPCVIDFMFQLSLVSAVKGSPRQMQVTVMTHIRQLSLRADKVPVTAHATDTSVLRDTIKGNAVGYDADGNAIFGLSELDSIVVDVSHEENDGNPHGSGELVWQPDLDFADQQSLVSPVESLDGSKQLHSSLNDLFSLLALQCSQEVSSTSSDEPRLNTFRAWLDDILENVASAFFEEAGCLFADISSDSRLSWIQKTLANLESTQAQLPAKAMYQVYQTCLQLCNGLELVEIEEDLSAQLHEALLPFNLHTFFSLASHQNPRLRILELNASQRNSTRTILDQVTPNGERFYAAYVYSDPTQHLIEVAQQKFGKTPEMRFVVFDPTKASVQDQGLEESSYDIVVDSSDTPISTEYLQTVHALLRPGGYYVHQVLNTDVKWCQFAKGVSGKWEKSPQSSLDASQFQSSGFVNPITYDSQFGATFLARTALKETPSSLSVTLLVSNVNSAVVENAKSAFSSRGYSCNLSTLHDGPPENEPIISLLDLEQPFFSNLTESTFKTFKEYLSRLNSHTVFWVTRLSQIQCPDPAYSLTLGTIRTIRREYPVSIATLELENVVVPEWGLILDVFNKFQQRYKHQEFDPEEEFVIFNKAVHIGRFRSLIIDDELSKDPNPDGPAEVVLGKEGSSLTVQWERATPVKKIADDNVEIEVKAAGLNVSDHLIYTGVNRKDRAMGALGMEGSGIVRSVGADVTRFSVGDSVMFLADGALSTLAIVSQQVCVKIPDSLDFLKASSIPVAFSVAIYSLIDRCRLQRDQSVLIHCATGGVGLAAIQICKLIGAQVYATVSNDAKAEYLASKYQIPAVNVFRSGDRSFVPALRGLTKGRGVDVVLNSLSGALFEASLECVAEFGTLIDIRKSPMSQNEAWAIQQLDGTKTLIRVNIDQIAEKKPEVVTSLLDRSIQYYYAGKIQPLPPVTVYEAAGIKDAFDFLGNRIHIGRVIVQLPERSTALPVVNKRAAPSFKQDCSYLLVGGLGGLGKAIAVWMAENGAKHLIFLARSANSPTHEAAIRELEALDCTVQLVAGDASVPEEVENVFKFAARPIRGVLQLSMVVRDASITNMSFEDWKVTLDPKVKGTWNLHESSKIRGDLDFFITFSSGSGLFGQFGQANYAAANTFLDAFAQYRKGLGLSSSVIDLSIMEEIGAMTADPKYLEMYKASGAYSLTENILLDAIHLTTKRAQQSSSDSLPATSAVHINPHHISLGLKSSLPLAAPNNRMIWKRDLRMGFYHNRERKANTGEEGGGSAVNEYLNKFGSSATRLRSKESFRALAQIIRDVMNPGGKDDVDMKTSLDQLGLDSLTALEARNWFLNTLGVEISVVDVARHSINGLGELGAVKLAEKREAAE